VNIDVILQNYFNVLSLIFKARFSSFAAFSLLLLSSNEVSPQHILLNWRINRLAKGSEYSFYTFSEKLTPLWC